MGRYKHPPLKACKEIIWQELKCVKGYDITYFPTEFDDCLILETSDFEAYSISLKKILRETGMTMDFQGLHKGKISIFFCRERLNSDPEYEEWAENVRKEREKN